MIETAACILGSYTVPLCFKETRQLKILLAFWAVITVYQCVSLINGYWFRTIGADVDAILFHENAVNILKSGEIGFALWADLYSNFLAFFYFLVGSESIVAGQSLSIILLSLSILFFIKLKNLLGLNGSTLLTVIMLTLLPAMVLYCPITLRESYEIFFFILSVHGFVLYYQIKDKKWFVISVLSALVLGLLHPGLTLFSLVLFSLYFMGIFDFSILKLAESLKKYKITGIIIFAVVSGMLFVLHSISWKKEGANLVDSLKDGNLIEYAVSQRQELIKAADAQHAKATYGVEFNSDSTLAFVKSAGAIYFHYFCSPYPWNVERMMDVYAVLENVWRLILVFFSIKTVCNVSENKGPMIVLLLGYMSLSFIWAMGTVNYGTAMRHHVVAYWILVLLGGPKLIQIVKQGLMNFTKDNTSKDELTDSCIR